MATNYFEMMRDTVGAYGEGVDVSRRRRAEDERAAREQAEFEQKQRDWAETNQRRAEVNDAVRGLRTAQEGVLQGQDTGMSQPSAQMLYQNGYGGAAGATAVRDAAGDMNREQARMGLQRTVDPTAAVRTRPATDLEINQAAQRVALANRDLGAWSNIEGNSRTLRVSDARKAELKRLNGMNYAELVGVFQESINDNPGVPAMVDFDPETRKYLVVSKVPGVPTQSLSRAEMLQSMMGLWEAGNGDYNAGIQAVVAGAKGQREIQDKNFERSRTMAQGNAGLYFKGRKADNDDQRTRNDGARLGLARAEAKRRAEMEKMAGGRVRQYKNKDGDIVEVFEVMTPKGLERREIPLPAGLRPVTQRDPTLQTELTKAYAADLGAAGDDPKKIDKVKNKYRAAGLEGLGEDPILAALAKAAGRPGADAQPAAGLRPPQTPSAPRRFDGQRFGVLTPRSMVEEAAAAGNPDAIRYLQAMEENAAMPRDTASMLAP